MLQSNPFLQHQQKISAAIRNGYSWQAVDPLSIGRAAKAQLRLGRSKLGGDFWGRLAGQAHHANAASANMVSMVHPWCSGFPLQFQVRDTMCTMCTIIFMHARNVPSVANTAIFHRMHETHGVDGANGVTMLKIKHFPPAPYMHHVHHHSAMPRSTNQNVPRLLVCISSVRAILRPVSASNTKTRPRYRFRNAAMILRSSLNPKSKLMLSA